MAFTPFKFLPLFRKPEKAKTSKRSGVRIVVEDLSRYFSLTHTAGYYKSTFELYI